MKLTRVACCALLSVVALVGCDGGTAASSLRAAKSHLEKSENKAAIIELKNALQKAPDSAEARFLLGKALLDIGDAKAAQVELTKAQALHFESDAVVPKLAAALSAQGKLHEVTAQYRSSKLVDPVADADLRNVVASAYLQQGNRSEAEAQLASALKSAQQYAPSLVLRARLLASGADTEGALKVVEQVLAAHPDVVDAWNLKGDLLYFAKQDAGGALAAYRQASKLRPDTSAAHTGAVSILIAAKDFQAADAEMAAFKKALPDSKEASYYEALLAFHRQHFEIAKRIAQQLLLVAPEDARLLHLAAAVELQAGATAQAESFALKALQKAPGNLSTMRLLAQIHLAEGQAAKVLGLLLPAVEHDGSDAELLALVGNAYLLLGDVQKAAAYFARAVQGNPNDIRSRTALAVARLSAGKPKDGFDELRSITLSDHGVTADLPLIGALLARKQYGEALAAVDVYQKKDPRNPLAPVLRGQVKLLQGNVVEARESFERSVALSPTYFPAVSALAALDMLDKKPDLAQKRLEKVLSVDAKNLPALLAIAQLRMKLGAGPSEVNGLIMRSIELNPAEPGPRLLLVERHMKAKEFDRAFSVAQAAVSAIPNNFGLIEALGQSQVATGNANQAIASFNRLVELAPQSPEPQLRLAEAFVALQKPEAAMQSLRRALAIAPDSIAAQRGLLSVQIANGQFKEARSFAHSVQARHPDQSLGYLFEGEAELASGDWDAAAACFRKGLDRQKTTGLAVKLHTALIRGGKRTEAERFAGAWLKEFPKDDVFLFYLADGALTRKEYASAEDYYRRFIGLRPDSPIALNNLAWATWKLRKPGAVALAERANQLAPNQAALIDTLATLLAENDRIQQALELQKRAVQLQPLMPSLRFNLAKLLIKTGDKEQAKAELKSLDKLGAGFGDHAEVDQLLKSL